MRLSVLSLLFLFAASLEPHRLVAAESPTTHPPRRPNIILVMADDMGWGQTGYYNHPALETPHLDAMAAAGLRLDRFYAGAPVCSPTRATVLTGRTNMRTGVEEHGYALRRQERTLAAALRDAGYATAHFGKWHLNGMRGPGVPILSSDSHNPGTFGFEHWLSVTNYFDRNPIMSRNGTFVEFQGDSSEIVVNEALHFIDEQATSDKPFFAVIWYGSPHSPFMASDQDQQPFADLPARSRQHYGELAAMDRSIGALQSRLRERDLIDDTLLWFCSDNGGLPRITPDTVGGLRGYKGSMYEGGLRVPAIVQWPSGIPTPRVTSYPASTLDIFPTIAEIVGLPPSASHQPQDGTSLVPLFDQDLQQREKPIPFQCFQDTVLLDNDYKLIHFARPGRPQRYELYDLANNPQESENLLDRRPEIAARLRQQMDAFKQSLARSVAGEDYSERRLLEGEPAPTPWAALEAYRPYLDDWKQRPEYAAAIRQHLRNTR